MTKTQKRKTGDLGEDIAVLFLMKQGFSILERNYLEKWGEIDVIAKKRGSLYFVEVKTVIFSKEYHHINNINLGKTKTVPCLVVTHETMVNKIKRVFCDIFSISARGYLIKEVTHETGDRFRPEDNLHRSKIERITRTIQTYLMKKEIEDGIDWFCDAVCVYLDEENRVANVEHIKNII
jgi:Holliday junction resolvase-like predicted endonuclease